MHTTGSIQRKDREGYQSLLHLWQLLLATWFALGTKIIFLLFVLINDVNYYLMKIIIFYRIRCKPKFQHKRWKFTTQQIAKFKMEIYNTTIYDTEKRYQT